MKTFAIIVTALAIWTLARCAEAQDRPECYQGDFVVNSHEARDQLKTVRCINGDLIWRLSFDEEDGVTVNIKKVSAPLLRQVDTIEIDAAYVVELDFPMLIKRPPMRKDADRIVDGTVPAAVWIDTEFAPMLCCYRVVWLAGQSGAGFNRACRKWACEP